jgi:ElaB/YqjD/DUF883 family membrane-anchored ribosome-binding protein
MNTTEFEQWQGETQEAAQDLRARAQEGARHLKETAEQWRRQVSETSRDAAKKANMYAREHPWTLVASVAVAGLVLGFFLARSRD